jgi:hypothetical protein
MRILFFTLLIIQIHHTTGSKFTISKAVHDNNRTDSVWWNNGVMYISNTDTVTNVRTVKEWNQQSVYKQLKKYEDEDRNHRNGRIRRSI